MAFAEFPSNWEVTVDPALTAAHRFGTVDTTRNARRLIASFRHREGVSWSGEFEGATRLPEALHGVFSYPDPDTILVAAAGQGYLVDSRDPTDWSQIDELPLVAHLAIPSLDRVILGDLIFVAAYGKAGQLWRTPRISYDGIRLVDADEHEIRGYAWSAPKEGEVPFSIDPISGAVRGGAAPGGAGAR